MRQADERGLSLSCHCLESAELSKEGEEIGNAEKAFRILCTCFAHSACEQCGGRSDLRALTGCPNRAVADVSAVADPNTGMYVYDTYSAGGWYLIGGTSASAPIIASVYALMGNAASTSYPVALPWQNENESYDCLNDIPAPETEYGYQTGLGSPLGTSCF